MTYVSEVRKLMTACEVHSTIYERKPTRASGTFRPLTEWQRRQVESLSIERGYRRFVADRMANV
jgi:hypothetical protein